MTANRPNLLLICTDQQHHAMMGCAGNRWVTTPAMDRLARSGVRFTRAYTTDPVCVPARFSLITGRMPSAIGLRSNDGDHIRRIDEKILTTGLGHTLSAAGYEAVYAGKQHLPVSAAEDYGFTVLTDDERDGCARVSSEYIARDHDRPFALMVHLINPHDICYMAIRESQRTDAEVRTVENGQVEVATLDEAIVLPEGVDRDEFFEKHCPPIPENLEPQEGEPRAITELVNRRAFRAIARSEWSDETWRMHRWAYRRLTERVDAQIAIILDALESSGRVDDTVVVFTSDHGDHDGAHRLEHKTTFYDEAARVPCIVAGPGVPRGVVDSTHLVSNGLDLFPTFADYAGSPTSADRRGLSLRRLLEASEPEWRTDLPIESEIGRCVVTSEYKYARYDAAGAEEQLVDLVRDPGEMRNVADDPEYSDALRECRGRWKDHFW